MDRAPGSHRSGRPEATASAALRTERLGPLEAQRLVTLLGLVGASVARHFQEEDPVRKARPSDTFQALLVGPRGTLFRDHFRQVAAATGAGHPARDCYASLVRWNTPTVEIRLGGSVLAVLPGVFGDGRTRSYTGDPGEEGFFVLLKECEGLELAANDLLQPVADRAVDVESADAVDRVVQATAVLAALRRLTLEFASRPAAAGGLRPDHFMDAFRQFAVRWDPHDVPPSGAQDPEFIRRDLLLGVDWPGYPAHLERIGPALLATERDALRAQGAVPAPPGRLLRRLRLSPGELRTATVGALRGLLSRHPVLGAWYLLLAANARYASTHLLLTERFLFGPQRQRDRDGRGDRPLVSNRRGTTGMDLPLLHQLADARRRHALTAFARVPRSELHRIVGATHLAGVTKEQAEVTVKRLL